MYDVIKQKCKDLCEQREDLYEGVGEDFVGNSYTIGDEVVYTAPYGKSKTFKQGLVVGFSKNGKKVFILSKTNLDNSLSGKYYFPDGKMVENVMKVVTE